MGQLEPIRYFIACVQTEYLLYNTVCEIADDLLFTTPLELVRIYIVHADWLLFVFVLFAMLIGR